MTNSGPDANLEQLTEGRIPYLAPDSLPNYLRTKLDLEIERKQHFVDNEVLNIGGGERGKGGSKYTFLLNN